MIVSITWMLVILYSLLTLLLGYGWSKLKHEHSGIAVADLRVTVLLPVRNEALNIGALLKDLQQQDYPMSLLEVIIIDDESSDDTITIVREFAKHCSYQLVVKSLQVPVGFTGSRKKKAITTGVNGSFGDVMICTDGDCRVGKQWVSTLAGFIKNNQAVFVSGPVLLTAGHGFWAKMQQLEFASLIATGAAFMQLGKPNMCNGANMSFSKESFFDVRGYEGYDHIHSGDDEFLLAKLYKKWPDRVYFLKDRQVMVKTEPKTSFRSFINQRKRWAGKWKFHTQLTTKLLAIFIFIVNLALILGVILSFFSEYPVIAILLQLLIKFIADYFFITIVMKFFNEKVNLFNILFLEILYPVYAVFIGLSSNFGAYEWKGRKLNN